MDFRPIAETLVEDVFKQVQQDRCLNKENLLRITRQALALFQADIMLRFLDQQTSGETSLVRASRNLLDALVADKGFVHASLDTMSCFHEVRRIIYRQDT